MGGMKRRCSWRSWLEVAGCRPWVNAGCHRFKPRACCAGTCVASYSRGEFSSVQPRCRFAATRLNRWHPTPRARSRTCNGIRIHMPKGYLQFVLHAHLPYVRHPEYDRFLEERWLFEALTETYIPLVKFFDRMRAENVPFKLTLSVSPTLANMLEDELLRERYVRHLDLSIKLAEREIDRTRH